MQHKITNGLLPVEIFHVFCVLQLVQKSYDKLYRISLWKVRLSGHIGTFRNDMLGLYVSEIYAATCQVLK
jgi:hypothetical protein